MHNSPDGSWESAEAFIALQPILTEQLFFSRPATFYKFCSKLQKLTDVLMNNYKQK